MDGKTAAYLYMLRKKLKTAEDEVKRLREELKDALSHKTITTEPESVISTVPNNSDLTSTVEPAETTVEPAKPKKSKKKNAKSD